MHTKSKTKLKGEGLRSRRVGEYKGVVGQPRPMSCGIKDISFKNIGFCTPPFRSPLLPKNLFENPFADILTSNRSGQN